LPRVADVDWKTARELAHASAQRLASQRLPLTRCVGTTLATALIARDAMPAFDTAAMDGYAMGSSQTCAVIGTLVAGEVPWTRVLAPGEAVRIATGASVPPGARYVLRQEDAVVAPGGATGDPTVCGPELPEGANIRRRGEDACAGDALVCAGTEVTVALLGLAAGCGYEELEVVAQPRVAAIVSGDEVAHDGAGLTPGQLRDAIGPMLPPLVGALGGALSMLRHVPDRPVQQLLTAIDDARAQDATVIVVSGATSVGPADGLRAVLAASAAEWVVESVACRPGHPQLLARFPDGPWIVGLPGNPYAALVAAHTLLGPLLAGLGGRPLPDLPQLVASPSLAQAIMPTRSGVTQLVPITWDGAPVGSPSARRPACLRAAAAADALAVVPAEWVPGDPVTAVPLARYAAP
jgi:molybdopterin molybdotransferase